MNILDKNLAESPMKTTDLWYETLPGLRPAAVAPPKGYARDPRWVQEPFLPWN
jgi:hypothetical protein